MKKMYEKCSGRLQQEIGKDNAQNNNEYTSENVDN